MPEIDSILIAGLTMWVVELFKKKGMDRFYAPVAAFLVAGAITSGWYWLFDPTIPLQVSLKQGFFLGAVSGGLYGFGKSVIKKNMETRNIGI